VVKSPPVATPVATDATMFQDVARSVATARRMLLSRLTGGGGIAKSVVG
jgi:hypothetical protein